MTGAELKKRREACGFSQEDLAAKLGVHSITISRWEREAQAIPLYLPLALKTIERESKKSPKT